MECDLRISNPEILGTLNLPVERAYPTPYSASPLLPLLILSLMRQRIGPKTATFIQNEYDYIVVGSGAGGSSVASRLSEMPCVNVLVIEAGKTAPVLSDIPGISRYFLGSDLDWQYWTVPQKNFAKAHVNRQIYWSSGKGLGGSSLIGGAIYQRGNRKVYDQWAAQGATGWSFQEVLPYFLKLEDNWDPDLLANGYHHVGGPVAAQRPGYQSEIKSPILEAARQMGYDLVDTNGPQQTGFSDFQGNIGGGQRCNSAEDYLVPAENRTNLDIFPNAHVTKVVLEGNTAVGVQFDCGGSTYTVKARREVILSAGAVNTPQILMNSGIGPKEHLQQLNIPVVADLPVGNNFQDHSVALHPYLLDPSILPIHKKLTNLRYLEEYISNRTGPLSSLDFVSAVAFLPRETDPPYSDFPSQQLIFTEFPVHFFKYMNIIPSVYEQYFAEYEDKPVYMCAACALQPKSRGVVRLRTSNPYDSPLIDPNYFADRSDVDDVIQALKVCHRIATSEPMKKVGSKLFDKPFPGCEQFAYNEDSYFECLARSLNIVLPHGVGTAKMGNPTDPTTVVDPQLRVKGVNGLRVVDASVMPIIPSGNTYIPTIMVGEKAADIIKRTISCPVPYY